MVKGQPMRFINGHVQRLPHDVDKRFWSRIQKTDGCWNWTGALNTHGYGHMRVNSRQTPMHRLSWEKANGPIPDGLSVLHKCDNRRCVRPDHLFLGTQADNMQDKIAKGRHRGGPNQPGYTGIGGAL